MNGMDILILIVIAAAVAAAILTIRKKKGGCSCSNNCNECSAALPDCCGKKPDIRSESGKTR